MPHGPPALPAAAAALLASAAWACGGALGSGFEGAADARSGVSLDELPPGAVEVVAEGLDTPWELRFLPGGDLLVTERAGDLVRIAIGDGGPASSRGAGGGRAGADGATDADRGPGRVVERHDLSGVRETGEAGLMGLALHPDYPDPPWIYVCLTTGSGGGLENRVVRFRYADGALSRRAVMLDGMEGAPVHDGCRLEFGPAGGLFVTMGDTGASGRARQRSSLNGKILRIDDEGGVPADNPFGTPVWTLGHRNPQGLAFDDAGRLWSTEHGPSGFASGRDELNLIEMGGDYGWPEITGGEAAEGLRAPVLHSGSATWAPAGLAYLDGRLWFGGLAGEALYEVRDLGLESERGGGADGSGPRDPARSRDGADAGGTAPGEGLDEASGRPPPLPRLVRHFAGELGRTRAVRAGPDDRLYLATSNRDGRGSPREGDDRVLAVDLTALGGG